jgi:hypothetical protein
MIDLGGDGSVTAIGQFDICEFVGDLFGDPPVSTTSLVAAARARGARPAVLDALRHLDHSSYEQFSDLVADLAHLPSAIDHWDLGS